MTTLWHGTTVGWLNRPDPKKKGRRSYGFKTGLNRFGETESAQDFIWLTEDITVAIRMSGIAKSAVERSIRFGKKDPFAGAPMKCGRYVYEVAPIAGAVVLDLAAPTLDERMLELVTEGLPKAAWALSWLQFLARRVDGTILQRRGRYLETEHGWLRWLESELGINPESDRGDNERWRRLAVFCRCSGIDFLINPTAQTHLNGALMGAKNEGYRDWAMMRLKTQRRVGGVTATYRTYKFRSVQAL